MEPCFHLAVTSLTARSLRFRVPARLIRGSSPGTAKGGPGGAVHCPNLNVFGIDGQLGLSFRLFVFVSHGAVTLFRVTRAVHFFHSVFSFFSFVMRVDINV